MIGRSFWCRGCLAGTVLAIVAGGGCADSVAPEPVAVETQRSAADAVGDEGETTAGSKAVAVGARISEIGRRQQPAIATLREAGWTVETNGVEEAVLAALEDAAVGKEPGRLLGELQTLEEIRLWDCADADDGLVNRLATLPQLRILVARGGNLTDGCLESLSRAPKLESLNLGKSAAVTGAGVAGLLAAGRLKRLYLDHTGLTDAALLSWPTENSLQMINLNHTSLGDPAAKALGHWRGLKSVFVVDTRISVEATGRLRSSLPECIVFDGRDGPPSAAETTPSRPAPR